jgi:hypothetical protein
MRLLQCQRQFLTAFESELDFAADITDILAKYLTGDTATKPTGCNWPGNHPIFQRPDFQASRGKFQFHGGGDVADAYVRELVVVCLYQVLKSFRPQLFSVSDQECLFDVLLLERLIGAGSLKLELLKI